MLIAEYDYDVDIAVQREEEREIALQEGIAQGEAKGFSLGIAQGKLEGFSDGSYQKALETAKTMLAMHYPLEDICKICGLSEAEIEKL
ncbi:hypothetical protein H9I36_10575 [Treponema sp. Marseille-Q4130]|nr:hypothetical protein [Treponema sp. Marseille-Q4130]